MSDADLLLVADPGHEGSSLLFNLASSYSDSVVWLAYEPPTMIESVLSSYDYKGELRIISSKQYKDYSLVNIMNLNEVSISMSKAAENLDHFSLIFTIIPELLLVHGLEKTYLFLLNTIWKVHSQGGTVFALLTKSTQDLRSEFMIRRLFPFTLKLQKKLGERGWERNIILESPIEDFGDDVIAIEPEGYKIEIPPNFKQSILRSIHE
ncbi:MAG: hypothetical protein R6U44_11290 [Archaeoglobaceae archaeon]